jgi:hypothetical protein
MTKRELIDKIISINPSASATFLARFDDVELDEYLAHLRVLETPRLSGHPERYEKYFRNCPTIPNSRPKWRTDSERIEEIAADGLDGPEALEALEIMDEPDDVEEPPEEPADELAQEPGDLSVSPAERQQLFADPVEPEPPEEDDPEPDLPEELPEELLIGDEADEPEPAVAETPQPAADAEDDAEDADEADLAEAPAEELPQPARSAVARATAGKRNAKRPSADSQEDAESWLY